MPQFETERLGGAEARIGRARDAEDAVRRAFDVPAEARIQVGPPDLRDAWCAVSVDDTPAGRVRPHARMRFRRD